MNKEKTSYDPTPGDYDTNKLTDIHSEIHSSESEASDTEDISQANNHSNISRSTLSKKSIDLNDDDDDDDKNIDII